MGSRILIADDEPHIRNVLRAYLEREGYDVLEAGDGETALGQARAEQPELMVLDVMLPGRSGFEVLRTLRAEGAQMGVLMLTARDDVIDRVAGLELGADDYVTKPFEPREVVARVGAILRRFGRADGSAVAGGSGLGAGSALPAGVAGTAATVPLILGEDGDRPRPGRWTLFDLTIDLETRDVFRGMTPLPLTRTELDLLAALSEQQGRVWTREQIGMRVFGESFDTFDRTIDSHVKNLRAKLGTRPDGGPYIETVRGVGYRAARIFERA